MKLLHLLELFEIGFRPVTKEVSVQMNMLSIFNMHKFLTEDIDFDKFPSKCCGCYIKGMPVQTFEAILQNISTRIFLYSMTTDGTYNARSISTLANENFFLMSTIWIKKA